MATNPLQIYEIEDTNTGQIYEIEAPIGTTEEDLFAFVSSQPKPAVQQEPQAPQQTQQTQAPSNPQDKLTPLQKGTGLVEVPTFEFENSPEIAAAAEQLFRSGVRSPGKFNSLLSQSFPDVGTFSVTAEQLSGARERQKFLDDNGITDQGIFIATLPTGMKDPEAPSGILDTAVEGIKRGAFNTVNSEIGLGALIADVVGADETSDSLLDLAAENDAKIALNLPRAVPTVQDIDSVGDAGLFALEAGAELLPQVASASATGLAGSLAGKKLAERQAREFVEDRVSRGVSKEIAEKEAAEFITEKAARRGAIAGTASQTTTQETGSTFSQTFQETGEKAPLSSVAVGITSGSLDAILPLRALNRLGIPSAVVKKSLARRILQEGGKDFAIEGATEAAQTFLQSLPTAVINGESPFTEQMFDQMVDSFARGGAGGFTVGVTTGAVQGIRGSRVLPPEAEATIVAPTSRRNSKQFRQELALAQNQVVDKVNSVTETWTNAPQIFVHKDFKSVPGLSDDALGAYTDKGEVVLNTEAILDFAKRKDITPDEAVTSVVFHEALGHHGLVQQYGEELDTVLGNLYDKGTDEFRQRVDDWLDANPDAYRVSPTNAAAEDPAYRLTRATEEVLAEEVGKKGVVSPGVVNQVLDLVKRFARQAGLDVKYSSREIRGILAVANNAVVKGGAQDGAPNGVRYMMTGLRGSENKTGSDIAPDEVFTAFERASNGEPAGPDSQIRKDTGWFIGPDRRWRMEIDDSNAGYNLERPLHRSSTLGDVLDHPALFDLYPELADVIVTRRSGLFKNDLGSYDPKTNTINISPNASNPKAVLLHEVQHKVQDIEGFSQGGSPRSALNRVSPTRLTKIAKKVKGYYAREAKKFETEAAAFKTAADDPLFQEYTDAYKEWSDNFHNPDVPKDSLQFVESGRRIEDVKKKLASKYLGEEDLKSPNISSKDRDDFQALLFNARPKPGTKTSNLLQASEDAASEGRGLRRLSKQVEASLNDVGKLRAVLSTDQHLPFQAYEHLFGEVEARDTANRMRFTEQERRDVVPFTSEAHINPDDFIFDAGLGPRESVERPAQTPKFAKAKDPLTVEGLTADDLVESENALGLLQKIAQNHTPTTVSFDNIEQEALLRNVKPSTVTRLVGKNAGDLVRRLFMYDIAAEKLNTRLLNIQEKITTNGLTEEDQLNYLKTLGTLEDLTAKIFDEQSELGRALGSLRRMNFTRKRVLTLQKALSEIGFEALHDPETFFKLMADVAEQSKAAQKRGSKGDTILSILNVPRSVMSSMDLSAPMRQGIVFVGTKEFWSSFFKMFSFLGPSGEANYAQVMKEISRRPTRDLMAQAGLSFSHIDGSLSQREEDFQSNLAEKIPGVRISNRAYSGFLNKLRADMFDKYVEQFSKAGVELDNNLLKGLGRFVNSATGRAELPGGLQSMAPQLNAAFFSPRLIQSRFNMLNPVFYTKLPAPVRKEAVKSMLSFGTIASLTVGAIAMMFPDEAEVELDPRSSDFGKMKIGNTRVDIGGGFLQYLTFGARTGAWLAGQPAVKTASGDLQELGADGFTQRRYGELAATFFRNKLSPNSSFIVDAAFEENAIGEPFELGSAVSSRILPMHFQSVMDAAKEYDTVTAIAVTSPGIFGIGVNTYLPKSLDKDQELEAPESFEMSDIDDGETDLALAKDGVVHLKGDAIEMWDATLNNYFRLFIKEDIVATGKEWEDLSPQEQKELIRIAKEDARAEAKADMLVELGIN